MKFISKMKNKVFLNIVLISTMLFAGFNYLPQFKVSSIPIFQFLIVISILLAFILSKGKSFPNLKEIKYYWFYLLTSVPALFIGILFQAENSFLIFIYTLFPFLLFITTFDKFDKEYYHKLLLLLSISMVLISIVGWLLRLYILPINTFFEVVDSEFELGYWGIGYKESTRNHDYLYPLIGLSISMYFFLIKRYKLFNLMLIFFFITTLIASLSRAALIISILSIIQLIRSSSRNVRMGVFFALFLIISLNYSFIKNEYVNKFDLIVNSIFKTKDIEGQFSNETRLIIIQDALESSFINPFGYGIDNYSSIYDKNFRGHISTSSENAYLTILVERGWLAFIFFMSLFFFSLKKSLGSNIMNLNKILLPFLVIYFLFNYELNNVFGTFVFYIVFLSMFFMKEDELKANQV